MKCPRCGFTSFDHLTSCRKCGRDFAQPASPLKISDLLGRLSLPRRKPATAPVVAESSPEAPAQETWDRLADSFPFPDPDPAPLAAPESPAPEDVEPQAPADLPSPAPEQEEPVAAEMDIEEIALFFSETEEHPLPVPEEPAKELSPAEPELMVEETDQVDQSDQLEQSDQSDPVEPQKEDVPMPIAACSAPSDSDAPASELIPEKPPEDFVLFSGETHCAAPALSTAGTPAEKIRLPALSLPAARLCAGAVDAAFLALVFLLFMTVGEMVRIPGEGVLPGAETLIELAVPYFLMLFILCFSYFTLLHHVAGQTPGKMLFKLKVESRDGEALSLEQAFLRSAGGLISLSLLGVGYLYMFFDEEGRGWNDRFAGSRVVRAPEPLGQE